jgi:preprotein translocase subunit SecA
MLTNVLKKVFGTNNERIIKSLQPYVSEINALESRYEKLSDQELAHQTVVFREELQNGKTLDDLLPAAFAVVREASKRTLGMRHFDVQLVGGIALHKGMIAEMRTGEGKTLVATLAAYLNALSQKGVHVVTVNDYLARRDSEWMGRLYQFLGLSVGVVYSGMREADKRLAYAADITYGQNNEFGFDYLRDNMKFEAAALVQRGHNFAIVDEVDSILIDEARTPLIISGPAEDSADLYKRVNQIIPSLKDTEHYEVELRSKAPTLTEAGVHKVEELLSIENLYDPENIEILHHVNQALKAHSTMERDVDYVVAKGQIVIVDEFTGRLMPGRRWSDGLHQAIEAKEGVAIQRENRTLASITFQNLFRLYNKLSGMTGTAITEAAEFKEIYNLNVLVIPTHRAMVRLDESDRVFRSRNDKYEAVCDDIAEVNKNGQPVLVGTISIEQSEAVSRSLQKRGIEHHVLNAKHHEQEASIVSQAGRYAAVTIATNMAGRGTDILLGGNPQILAVAESKTKDRKDPAYIEAFEKYSRICEEEKAKVLAAGGLFIMGTERHESRRIDNQLRGRAGRQGDPGRSRFYISLEDDLMKRFAGDKIQMLMKRFGWEEGMSLDGRIVSRSIEQAQTRVERFHFESRKHVTEYDDVMNRQRKVIYGLRNKILFGKGIREEILGFIDDLSEEFCLAICDEKKKPSEWDLAEFNRRFSYLFKHELNLTQFPGSVQQTFDFARNQAKEYYLRHAEEQQATMANFKSQFNKNGAVKISFSEDGEQEFDFEFSSHEQGVVLEALDYFWNAHLQDMDHLREGIGLRGYGQKNPLHEYQREGYVLFSAMLNSFKEHAVRSLCYSDTSRLEKLLEAFEAERQRRAEIEKQMQMVHASAEESNKAVAEDVLQIEAATPKSPDSQRQKLDEMRKLRRKMGK